MIELSLADHLLGGDEVVGLVQVAPHRERDDRQQRADDERDAPAPRLQLIRREEHLLQEQQDKDGAQLAADQRHVLKAGIEAAVLLVGDLGQVGGAGAVFAAKAQALNHAREAEQHRRRDADRGVGRRDRDHQRSEAHEQHRKHQRVAPAVVIGEMAEQPAADGPHDEAERKQDSGVQLLDDRIVAGKERAGEIERERRIGVEVVPLDQVADRTDEDRLHAAPHVSELKLFAAPYGRWQGHCKLFYHNDMVACDASEPRRSHPWITAIKTLHGYNREGMAVYHYS